MRLAATVHPHFGRIACLTGITLGKFLPAHQHKVILHLVILHTFSLHPNCETATTLLWLLRDCRSCYECLCCSGAAGVAVRSGQGQEPSAHMAAGLWRHRHLPGPRNM